METVPGYIARKMEVRKLTLVYVTEERDAFEGIYTVYQLLYIPPPKLTAWIPLPPLLMPSLMQGHTQ